MRKAPEVRDTPSPTGEGVDVQAAFELFWGFEKQPALFQVARRGAWAAIAHPTSELKVSSKLRIAYCILLPIYNLIFSNCSLEQ